MRKIVILFSLVIILVTFSNLNILEASSTTEEQKRFHEVSKIQAYKWKELNDFKKLKEDDDFFNEVFSGMYFEEDVLYINVTKGNLEEFRKSFEVDFEYVIVEVEYSLAELYSTKQHILDMSEILPIRAISIDEVENTIEVYTNHSVEDFSNILNKEIYFENIEVLEWDNRIQEHTNYTVNGEKTRIGSVFWGYSDCTVGFAAKNSDGDPGFVTAGHCMDNFSYGKDVYYEGNHAGDTRNFRYRDGDVDAGFVELRDPLFGTTWLPTKNLVHGGSYDYVWSFSSNLPIGTNVEFQGTYGPNDTCVYNSFYGQITDSDFTYLNPNDSSDIWFDNMIMTNIATYSKDSGGPLLTTIYIGEGYYEYNVIGILHGGNSIDISVYSKSGDILNYLDLTGY
jgi:hypothetical protein